MVNLLVQVPIRFRRSTPSHSYEAKVKEVLARKSGLQNLDAPHWWSGVVWATAAVALHNVQQNNSYPGWKSKLQFSEDPLTYLGILVDLLQEWDRPSARRVGSVGGDRRRINASDVNIGFDFDGKIALEFGCRDSDATRREAKMKRDLDAALDGWDRLVSFSFRDL